MTMEETYGPEDIEQLLMSKDFSELYPEEKAYVLLHMEDEAEYNSLRLMLSDLSSSEDEIVPPAAMRDSMISMHESRHKSSSFKIWLNSVLAVFAFPEEWKRPARQLAGVAGAIVLVVFVYQVVTPTTSTGELAYEPVSQEQSSPSVLQEESELSPPSDAEPLRKTNQEKPTAPMEEAKESEDLGRIVANQASMDEKTEQLESIAESAPGEVFNTEVVAIVEDDEAELEETIMELADEEELDDAEIVVTANREETSVASEVKAEFW